MRANPPTGARMSDEHKHMLVMTREAQSLERSVRKHKADKRKMKAEIKGWKEQSDTLTQQGE